MATFHLTDPGGATYEIEAPDEHAAVSALQGLHGGSAPAPAAQGEQSPLGGPMPTAADLAAKGMGAQPGMAAEGGALNNVVRSLANGMMLGFGDRITAGLGALTGIGGQQGDYAGNLTKQRGLTQDFQTQHPVETTGANMVGTGLTAAALPIAAPATAFGRLLMGVGTGAVVGGVQGASESPDLADIGRTAESAKQGAELGALGGAAAPAIGGALGRVITPLPIGLPRATDVGFLKQAGIPLSAGQITGNKPLHVLESVLSEMPFSGGGAQKLAESQNQAFTSALLARKGVVGDRTDPATMDAAFNSLGDIFRNESRGKFMNRDPQLGQDANDALAEYLDKVSPANAAPLPAKLVNDLFPPPPPEPTPLGVGASESGTPGDRISAVLANPPNRDGHRVMLSTVRNALGDLSPAEQDAAIKAYRHPEAVLYPNDNRPTITQDQKDNAVYIGNEPRHFFFVGDGFKGAYERRLQTDPSMRAIGRETDVLREPPTTGGPLSGEAYQAQRSSLSNDSHSMRFSDPQQARFYASLRDAMDAAFERSNPESAAALEEARQNWGGLKDIAKAGAGAGSDTAGGFVSPQKMRSVIASGNNRIDYARGKGDFADLVRAGNAVMTPFPNSGTAGRINAMHMIGLLGGGGLGGMEAGFPGAAIGALAGPAIVGHTLMSRPMQGYLANQLLPTGIDIPALGSAMAAALAARQDTR